MYVEQIVRRRKHAKYWNSRYQQSFLNSYLDHVGAPAGAASIDPPNVDFWNGFLWGIVRVKNVVQGETVVEVAAPVHANVAPPLHLASAVETAERPRHSI
eukprot:1289511-Amphidinium_carterae.1